MASPAQAQPAQVYASKNGICVRFMMNEDLHRFCTEAVSAATLVTGVYLNERFEGGLFVELREPNLVCVGVVVASGSRLTTTCWTSQQEEPEPRGKSMPTRRELQTVSMLVAVVAASPEVRRAISRAVQPEIYHALSTVMGALDREDPNVMVSECLLPPHEPLACQMVWLRQLYTEASMGRSGNFRFTSMAKEEGATTCLRSDAVQLLRR